MVDGGYRWRDRCIALPPAPVQRARGIRVKIIAANFARRETAGFDQTRAGIFTFLFPSFSHPLSFFASLSRWARESDK